MPVADWFVDGTNGNDSNDGDSWAAAKATIQAGLNLVDGTSQIVAIAPGIYNENLTNPATAGSSGNWNELVGDSNEIYTDGSAATHGLGINPIINFVRDNDTVTWDDGTKYNYWRIRSMAFFQLSGTGGSGDTHNGVFLKDMPDNFEMYDIYSFGEGQGLIINFNADTSATGTEAVKLFRCIGIGVNTPGIEIKSTFTSMPGSSIIELNSCIGQELGKFQTNGSDCAGIIIGGRNANQFVWATLNNCSGWSYLADDTHGAVSVGIRGGTTTNGKVTATRCFGSGWKGIAGFTATSTFTNCYGEATLTTSETSGNDTDLGGGSFDLIDINHYLPPPLLVADSPLGDALSDFSSSLTDEQVYDMFGRLFDQTPGAQEYVDGIEQTYAPPGYTHDDNGGRGILWTEDVINGGAGDGGVAMQHIVGGS